MWVPIYSDKDFQEILEYQTRFFGILNLSEKYRAMFACFGFGHTRPVNVKDLIAAGQEHITAKEKPSTVSEEFIYKRMPHLLVQFVLAMAAKKAPAFSQVFDNLEKVALKTVQNPPQRHPDLSAFNAEIRTTTKDISVATLLSKFSA